MPEDKMRQIDFACIKGCARSLVLSKCTGISQGPEVSSLSGELIRLMEDSRLIWRDFYVVPASLDAVWYVSAAPEYRDAAVHKIVRRLADENDRIDNSYINEMRQGVENSINTWLGV